MADVLTERASLDLGGVPETMLWTLYARAAESARADGVLHDPLAERLCASIAYDFAARFGPPNRIFARRAAQIDAVLRRWLSRHPMGVVVSLGEGLETQAWRVDNGTMRWLSIDLPEAIAAREQLIAPTARFHHLAANAADPAWIDRIEPGGGVFIVAQGLLMYLQPTQVEALFVAIANRLPGAAMIFDVVHRSVSRSTTAGVRWTADYTLPAMPWGIERGEIRPTLARWHPDLGRVAFVPLRHPSRLPDKIVALREWLTGRQQRELTLVRVDTRPQEPAGGFAKNR